MATLAKALADPGVELRVGHQGGSSIARAIDRWIYVFTARMMLLATAIPLVAPIDRISWLPTTMPASFFTTELYMLAVVAPMFIWDVIRNRTVHEAYLIWLAVNLPFAIALHVLWRSPWWHSVVPRLMGV